MPKAPKKFEIIQKKKKRKKEHVYMTHISKERPLD
jgi:hypothetical protein